jgi:hypothetical protein
MMLKQISGQLLLFWTVERFNRINKRQKSRIPTSEGIDPHCEWTSYIL